MRGCQLDTCRASLEVEGREEADAGVVGIEAKVRTVGKTGAEMEALTAVSVAALTIYDMCKAVDKKMVISRVYLVSKSKSALPAEGR